MQLPAVEMSVFEAILARRSVRSYAEQPVTRATLHTLLEAAVRAPTALHREPWAFVVVQDRPLLQRLSDRAKPLFLEEASRSGHALEAFSQPDFNVFYDAGTLVIICARHNELLADADCWLAAENLLLAATALELGSCVIGAALSALNLAEIKAELGIPPEFSAVVPIIVGYSRGEITRTLRKKPHVLCWH